jgi:hypothetical protein
MGVRSVCDGRSRFWSWGLESNWETKSSWRWIVLLWRELVLLWNRTEKIPEETKGRKTLRVGPELEEQI